jgi:hypothetical protein
MLRLCDSVTLVNPTPSLAARGREHGWEFLHVERPWKSRAGFALRVLALLAGIGRDPGGLLKDRP